VGWGGRDGCDYCEVIIMIIIIIKCLFLFLAREEVGVYFIVFVCFEKMIRLQKSSSSGIDSVTVLSRDGQRTPRRRLRPPKFGSISIGSGRAK
jgi:hypothetical protein